MKKIISILSILLIACFALTSCGSFSTAEDGKIIKAITTKEEKDGTIKMVISYTDEELAMMSLFFQEVLQEMVLRVYLRMNHLTKQV